MSDASSGSVETRGAIHASAAAKTAGTTSAAHTSGATGISGAVDEAICELCITADNAEWLAEFAHSLLEKRLVACANISPIRSIYRWKAGIEDHMEARAVFHTKLSLFDVIAGEVERNHPYELPAVFTLPIHDASEAYRAWVLAETADPVVATAATDAGRR